MRLLSRLESWFRIPMAAAIAMFMILLLIGSAPAHAQDPKVKDMVEKEEEAPAKEEKEAVEEKPKGPVDELDRGSPRSCFLGFVESARKSDYERAAKYLDLRDLPWNVQGIEGTELARRLKIVLDRALWIDVHTLSKDPEGVTDDGLPEHRDSFGRIEVDDETFDLLMQRVPREDGVSIWKISNATIGLIPRLHEIYGYGAIGEELSRIMPEFEFFGLQTWQWLMMIGLLGVCYLAVILPTWFVAWLLRRRKSILADELARFVCGSFRFLIAVLMARSWIDVIHPGVVARAYLEGYTLVTIIVAWVMVRLIGVFHRYWTRRLEARDRAQAVVLLRPAANVVKILVVLIAIMIWFENLGFRATTLITGLGIGGLAVALAAQKPIENMIGAITLFISAPVRVGDFCRFGDKIGTVEEIGLRATKVRTLNRTAVFVPNKAFVDMQLENFAERERVLYRPNIGLRYDATPDQVRYILVEVRKMLYSHPKIDPDPARVRFVSFGESSLDLDIFAYVQTTDWNEYLGVAEDLNLRIMDIVDQAGSSLAFPTQTISLERAERPDDDAAKMAEAKVKEWRSKNELNLPRFTDEKIAELRGTLPYPPEGSTQSGSE